MVFDKLEQQLKSFFRTEASRTPQSVRKLVVKESALQEFARRKKASPFTLAWKSNWIRSAALGAIVLSLMPILGGERSAGELRPSGLVEIVRDGEVLIADQKTKLKIGDQVLVGNNASAEIEMRKSIKTTAGNRTEFRVTKPNSLFLVRGNLDGEIKKEASIATDRGQISGEEATIRIAVSETGETHIQPQTSKIKVTTWDNQKTTLAAGEELRLHTDATLPEVLPKNLNLSSSQILAIRAKLLIARTKALNALEAKLAENEETFVREIDSADRSFRSVVQVLKSSRNLEIVRRENLDLVSRADVVERVSERTDRSKLIAETRAVEALLDIVENEQTPQFTVLDSDLRIFNRYILLQRLFAPLATNSRVHGNILQEQYLEALAKQIRDAEDSELEIRTILSSIPRSAAGNLFLQRVSFYLSPSLQDLLESLTYRWPEDL